jgi:type VI secretion system protein VasD
MRRVTDALVLVLAVAALGLLSGCPKTVASLMPTSFEARLVASASLNPEPGGRASPLVVRLYELKDNAAFERADFFDLWDNESATLGADLVARDEIQLEPGQQRKVERSLDDATRYLGVVAAYRDLDNSEWRAIVPIRQNHGNDFSIGLGGQAVTVVPR